MILGVLLQSTSFSTNYGVRFQTCTSNQYTCQNSGLCIDMRNVCDCRMVSKTFFKFAKLNIKH